MERIDELFYYDESSRTCIRWKVDRFSGNRNQMKSAVAGQEAGSLDAKGEAFVTRLNRKHIKVHTVVLALHGKHCKENEVVDHIDGNPTNNKISNLRIVTQVVNSHNRKKQVNNSSGKTGVNLWKDHREKLFWKARWQCDAGKRGSKLFSINKYGNEKAFELACNYRDSMIQYLNTLGHNYTERHGN